MHNCVDYFLEETAIRVLALAFGLLTNCRRVGSPSAGMEGFLDDEMAVPFADARRLVVQ